MKIAIIGAGFTGLSSAYYLSKESHEVEVFEIDDKPGGLAVGYKEKEWNWTLEKHYHHWFANDTSVLNLAREINHKVFIPRPKTSSLVGNDIFQLDSPISLLQFPKLTFLQRIRMGASLALLKYNPYWKPLEKYKAEPYLKKTMGEKGYNTIWKPLMKNKLGKYSNKVSLAWFWARVYKRTPNLAYPEGGFLHFAKHIQKKIEENKGVFFYNTEVNNISSKSKVEISLKKRGGDKLEVKSFDKVIVTLPSLLFTKITPGLPDSYGKKTKERISIGATNLVLRLRKQFLQDSSYWLNICDVNSPVLAVVEHTNYMDKKHYGNEHIVYLGNYMERNDPRFQMSEDEVFKSYEPLLKKINPDFKKNLISYTLFKAPFAQPIIFPNYSKDIPPFKTPLKNVFLANIEQVYPWDRGTNYAVELGHKIAKIVQ